MENSKNKAETKIVNENKKKPQKKSESYALKAMTTHLQTLVEAKLITTEERGEINIILNKAITKHVKKQYGLQGE